MDISKLCVNCFANIGEGTYCGNCGYNDGDLPKNEIHLSPGTVLKGHYLIGKVLGHGGFGVTYLAYDLNLQTIRAIKEYLPGELSTRSSDGLTIHSYSGEAAENYQYGLEKFVEEGRMLAKYSGVPTIVSVYDYFNENNTAYLVMEYLDGVDLSEYVNKVGGNVSFQEALRLLYPVFNALEEIHKTGMIHRDISPDNIFITKKGVTKLLDFGTARQAMGEKSKSLSVILKPGYAPPEQYFSKGKQGPWTDIYALASTIYRLVVGNSLSEAMERQMGDDAELINNIDEYIPDNAKQTILKALSLKSEDRQQNLQEFMHELYRPISKGKQENKQDIVFEHLHDEKVQEPEIIQKNPTRKKKKKLIIGLSTVFVTIVCVVLVVVLVVLPRELVAYEEPINEVEVVKNTDETMKPIEKLEFSISSQWENSIELDTTKESFVYDVDLKRNGGFIGYGYIENEDSGWLIDINEDGKKISEKKIENLPDGIIETTNGKYLGQTYEWTTNREYDSIIRMYDENMNIEWEKRFGGTKTDDLSCILETDDGGFILAGQTFSSDGDVRELNGELDYWIVKINSMGDIDWEKSYGGSGYDYFSTIIKASNGLYVMAGYIESSDGDRTGNNGWIVAIDKNGNIQWDKSIGDLCIADIKETNDGGYVVLGIDTAEEFSDTDSDEECWGMKLDGKGNLLWEKSLCYESSIYGSLYKGDNDLIYFLVSTGEKVYRDDGGYYSEYKKYSLVVLDENGNKIFEKIIDKAGGEKDIVNIKMISDNEFITTGYIVNSDIEIDSDTRYYETLKTDSLIIEKYKINIH